MKSFREFLGEKQKELHSIITEVESTILLPALKHLEETTPHIAIKNSNGEHRYTDQIYWTGGWYSTKYRIDGQIDYEETYNNLWNYIRTSILEYPDFVITFENGNFKFTYKDDIGVRIDFARISGEFNGGFPAILIYLHVHTK